MTDQGLIQRAKEMLPKAWAPYSHFQVGAALLGVDGKVYTGCNIESAAFGAGLCAERAAIAQAFAAGCRWFTRAAVISSGAAICTPCGICRQLLFEFGADLQILCCRGDGSYEVYSAAELLPHGFGADSMA